MEMLYEGNFVALDHGQGLYSLYLHLSEFKIAEGNWVEAGDVIALSGSTGKGTGPHLHTSVRWQGIYIDPAEMYALNLPALESQPVRSFTSRQKPGLSRARKPAAEQPKPEKPVEIVRPKVIFTSDTDRLSQGECAQLSWKVSHAYETRLDGAKVKSTGEQKVCPALTKNYNLSVKASDGSTSEYEVTINVQRPRYSFAVKAPTAVWTNQSGEALLFGLDSGDRGRALSREGIKLEDGSKQNNVIEMRPMLGGSISGTYRLSSAIQRGDTFRVAIGFADRVRPGRVFLRVVFEQESSGRKKVSRELIKFEKDRNGWVPEWEYDLGRFAGRRGAILISLAFDSPTAGICWINPRIER